MSSDESLEANQKAVLAELTKPDHGLKHVEPPPAESFSTTQAKVLLEVQGQHELHHVEPPAEPLSTTQAKIILEVQGGKHELHHVDNPPKEGLTDAEKQAYLEEKQQAQE
jgi:peptidyl-tRNA hydrolase